MVPSFYARMDPHKSLPYQPPQQLGSEELDILRPYLSSTEGNVFALYGLTGIVGGAFARYSRQKGGVKQSLLEFVKDGRMDPVKSKELMERILIQYGDDSVGELEGAHVALEEISILATKEIEDRRIGGSPIEQSSRYVVYDHRDANGNYRYYRDDTICRGDAGEKYVAAMDFLFDTYCSLLEPLTAYFRSVKPIEEAEYDILGTGERQRYAQMEDERRRKDFERTYRIDLNTKVCDTLRCLLPASTLTNVGLFGNGRFYQTLLTRLYSSDLPEFNRIGEGMHEALNQTIPVYVKRAKRDEYLVQTRKAIGFLAKELVPGAVPSQGESVSLLLGPYSSEDFMMHLCSELLFPHLSERTDAIRQALKERIGQEPGLYGRILETAAGGRRTRRDHLVRGFEYGYPFTFEIVADYGMYRDLQRHRMMTQQRQLLTPSLGFHLPPELVEAGLDAPVLEAYRRSQEAYEVLQAEHGREMAQYALCMGYNIRFTFGMNLRELSHFIELRTAPQGHPNYRRVANKMLELLPEEFKFLCRFADRNEYYWARGDSEARQRVKERKLDERS